MGTTVICQADGYADCGAVSTKLKLTPLGCWDHCRRKLKEARSCSPTKVKVRAGRISPCSRSASCIKLNER
ncbi:MAG: transposase [Gammaproteobacteria bacterium]|nr:transposase [Gammaproteobacteria bacterium]